MATIPEAWVSKVKELLKGEIFTADKPGKWAGKEGSHVPVAARNNEGSIDLKVRAAVRPRSGRGPAETLLCGQDRPAGHAACLRFWTSLNTPALSPATPPRSPTS